MGREVKVDEIDTYSIPVTGLPSEGHGPKVKQLDVSVVVSGTHAPLRVTE